MTEYERDVTMGPTTAGTERAIREAAMACVHVHAEPAGGVITAPSS